MHHRKSRMGTSRDFGTEGAGKGDSDRTTDRDAYERNLAEIPLDGNVEGFRKVGLKQVKTYGKKSEPDFFAVPPAFGGFDESVPTVFAHSPWLNPDGTIEQAPPGGWTAPTTDLIRE